MFKIFDSLRWSTKRAATAQFTVPLKKSIQILMTEPPTNPTAMSQEEARKLVQRIHELLTEDPKMFVRRRVEELLNKEPTPPPTQNSPNPTTTPQSSNPSLTKDKEPANP